MRPLYLVVGVLLHRSAEARRLDSGFSDDIRTTEGVKWRTGQLGRQRSRGQSFVTLDGIFRREAQAEASDLSVELLSLSD